MNQTPQSHGPALDAPKLRDLLDFLVESQLADEAADGTRPTPLCIWGSHGLGKTQLVEEHARRKGWRFKTVAPAQFEELGDLHGLPVRHEGGHTAYLPPQWVPREPGPGILLLDDLNRAPDHVLRALMQLLQRYELFSWSLPAGWQIVCTANPEGGDYTITSMDDAMRTRMLNVELSFDAKAWAEWATEAGVDPRGVAFVLTYPEVAVGPRTTPRTLVQFFARLRHIPDLAAQIDRVGTLAKACLEDVTAWEFLSFVRDGLPHLVSPEELLDAAAVGPVIARIKETSVEGDTRRVDRLALLCTRLILTVRRSRYTPTARHGKNVRALLMADILPADLRVGLYRDLQASGDAVAAMLHDAALAERMLEVL